MSRRRRRKHEDHQNHEAWAIPYGDLVTLLLAFFVVMYALSTVNEGKYRVLSDSLFAAFRGAPRTLEPVQVGDKQVGSGADVKTTLVQQSMLEGQPRSMLEPIPVQTGLPRTKEAMTEHQALTQAGLDVKSLERAAAASRALESVANEVVRAMDDLVKANLVFVRRKSNMIEVEIRTDILFPSGSATLSPNAVHVIERLAEAIKSYPNPVRVEGHTDSRPVHTLAFPSNWELSAARAASVVHVFANKGVDPDKLAVIGHSQYRPAQANDSEEGRNANRRVVIVILSSDTPMPADPAGEPASAPAPAVAAPAVAAPAAAPPATTPVSSPSAAVIPAPIAATGPAVRSGTLPAP
ncbi:MAG TPA: flagellar motor protein MotD [Steroidobacteraceae bacterium]|nr:flagellar motor protein MotD [Steroidobacteraceae bacterium]